MIPIPSSFHWLSHIQHKLLILNFKALHGFAPHSPSFLISHHVPTCDLWLSSITILYCQKVSCSLKSPLPFSCASPYAWNSISQQVHNSTSLSSIKSHLQQSLIRTCLWNSGTDLMISLNYFDCIVFLFYPCLFTLSRILDDKRLGVSCYFLCKAPSSL